MALYILKRIFWMIPTLFVISIISFALIQLPPGDYLTSFIMAASASGDVVDQALIDSLRKQYGLDKPMFVQYFTWVWNMLHGDFGYSFEWQQPVSEIIWSRLGLTLVVSVCTLVFTWVAAIPIGIYSATHQYSLGDYAFTFIGFIGLATPNFLLALILMYVGFSYFGTSVGGLFSPEFAKAPLSMAKILDLLEHLWIPVVVVGTAGTAGLIRIMRGNLLDELRKQYVITARAKGLRETVILFRYPVRIAINPLISTIGWTLPALISGVVITAVVLSLPTTGPILLRALMSQDMYLAGSFVLILASLTVIGTLISDILLAAVDPRIRLQRTQAGKKA